ncbi:MAG TPA: hemerythrin domain-containing protein [Polyangiaceae bacterium]|nr:hemerythrin domain-containing protein [Polyangiaceae bacterium]
MQREPTSELILERRELLRNVASAAGILLVGCAASGANRPEAGSPNKGKEDKDKEGEEAEVTPGEDLMQEHGVLERILLIYDEAARRIDAKESFDLSVVKSSADIVKRFIENYHEKNEEQFVFPRLQAAGREVDLVTVLLLQHKRGREVTDDILRRSATSATPELAQALRSFTRMYRPHAAREDTVLFPAFRDVMGRDAYRELGEQFEDKEHELIGEHGFENTVAEVARLEAALGIGELAKFTPA